MIILSDGYVLMGMFNNVGVCLVFFFGGSFLLSIQKLGIIVLLPVQNVQKKPNQFITFAEFLPYVTTSYLSCSNLAQENPSPHSDSTRLLRLTLFPCNNLTNMHEYTTKTNKKTGFRLNEENYCIR